MIQGFILAAAFASQEEWDGIPCTQGPRLRTDPGMCLHQLLLPQQMSSGHLAAVSLLQHVNLNSYGLTLDYSISTLKLVT